MVKFYGLKPWELEQLSAITAHHLYNAIGVIEAKDLLNQIAVACYPHQEKDQRRQLLSRLEKQAQVKTKVDGPKVSNEDLDIWLRGVLGG